jgi:hypothetical protein
MNRRSVISELAKTLQISETEAEQILRAFAQVLGPIAAEVPPYFERYFEAQIQLVLQRMEDFQHTTQQQIANLQQRIEDFQHFHPATNLPTYGSVWKIFSTSHSNKLPTYSSGWKIFNTSHSSG